MAAKRSAKCLPKSATDDKLELANSAASVAVMPFTSLSMAVKSAVAEMSFNLCLCVPGKRRLNNCYKYRYGARNIYIYIYILFFSHKDSSSQGRQWPVRAVVGATGNGLNLGGRVNVDLRGATRWRRWRR